MRAVIVDDERLSRKQLQTLLAAHAGIEFAGEADSADAGLRLIERVRPDLLFLDIQMPGKSGFDLLAELNVPVRVIFVTAYDQFAIRAFEVNALDYLLKPVNPDRLTGALARLDRPAASNRMPNRLALHDYLFLDAGGAPRFVKVNSILCIRSAGPYSEVVTADGRTTLLLQSMKDWEGRLPAGQFARVHRSTIVNLNYVDKVEALPNYSYEVSLRGGQPVVMSRRRAARLKDSLG